MFKRKILPLTLIVIFAASFFAFKYQTGKKEQTKQQKILTAISSIIEEIHYDPKKIDDQFSKDLFKKFFETLDADKNFFTEADISNFKKYELKLDDEIHGNESQFLQEVSKVFTQRVKEANTLYVDILSKPFDFTINETAVLDADKLKFPTTEEERKKRWHLRLKYLALDRYADLLETREKNKTKKDFVVKSDSELEIEARSKVSKIMDKIFDRYKFKFNDDDIFNIFLNSITNLMDPHSDYFAPVDKRYFDEQFTGKFYGIGATLREEDGNIKIGSVVVGSPAAKTGEIHAGDIILKVGQKANEPVDLTGYTVEDAVKIIRGEKGAEVRLTVKKQDGTIKVVSIIRDEIVQDEAYARSAIVNGKNKIGYIYLSDFYADFNRPNTLSCALDVAKEVKKLKDENVDGIILDLRFNGGGSLSEVIKMVGLFIEDGPVVQVKEKEGKSSVLYDRDKTVLYNGPFVVMVNELSASASEIFAAAIQDYKRGVIVGSTSTFGKGTVQRSIPFGKPLDFFNGSTEFGEVKLTLQKFYRINGGSTQLKGVIPDIIIPDQYEYMKIREKDYPTALPWDEISKSNYKTWSADFNLAELKAKSETRIKDFVGFSLINNNAQWLSKENDRVYNLNLIEYQNNTKKIRETVKQINSIVNLDKEMNVSGLSIDDYKYNNVDKEKGERYKQWIKNLRKDIYLNEAVNVVSDIVNSNTTKTVKK